MSRTLISPHFHHGLGVVTCGGIWAYLLKQKWNLTELDKSPEDDGHSLNWTHPKEDWIHSTWNVFLEPLEQPIVRKSKTLSRTIVPNTPIKTRPFDNHGNQAHDSAIQARSIGICFSMRIIVEMRLKTGPVPHVWWHRGAVVSYLQPRLGSAAKASGSLRLWEFWWL